MTSYRGPTARFFAVYFCLSFFKATGHRFDPSEPFARDRSGNAILKATELLHFFHPNRTVSLNYHSSAGLHRGHGRPFRVVTVQINQSWAELRSSAPLRPIWHLTLHPLLKNRIKSVNF